jgi:glucose dehydrogenase
MAPACSNDATHAPADGSVHEIPDASLPDASLPDAAPGDAGTSAVRPDGADAGPAKGPPPEVLESPHDWPMANHDYQATRAAIGSSITRANVANLEEAWSFEIPGGGTFGAATAVPIVIGDVVYYQDMGSNVFALDRVTGKVIWQKKYSRTTPGPNGLAVGWGKIFAATSDRTFAALDLGTGKELWTASIPVPKNGGIDIPPLAYDGLVYTSTVPANSNAGYVGAASGTLYAIDQRDGRIVWAFDTDESGNLWGNETVNSGGGAWCPPTVDIAKGTLYWGTGNPGPIAGTADFPGGSSRPGPNLYTSSVLALSHDQGKLLWYHQEKPHDLFDLDFQNSPIIVDLFIQRVRRHAVIGSGKTGTVVALDAETGEVLWRTPVGRHENDEATTVPDAGLWVYPGGLGGVETAIAYSDGVVYVPIDNAAQFYTPTGPTDNSDPAGAFLALDAATGAVMWQVDYGSNDGGTSGDLDVGGATVVNDLVVTSTLDGTIRAYDKSSGEAVWTYAAPAGINAPPAIAGDTLYVAAGAGLGVPKLIALRLK